MIDELLQDAREHMDKSVEATRTKFQSVRAGRASPSLLDRISVDYYGAILRAYYDGKQTFLQQVEHSRNYRAGDLWGSVGTWASGRWYLGTSQSYAQQVRRRVADRVWRTADFDNG